MVDKHDIPGGGATAEACSNAVFIGAPESFGENNRRACAAKNAGTEGGGKGLLRIRIIPGFMMERLKKSIQDSMSKCHG